MTELHAWLDECLRVFPRLKKYSMNVEYRRLRQGILAQIKGQIITHIDMDPEALLLGGKVIKRQKKKMEKNFSIVINEQLKLIRNPLLRKQLIQNSMIHELLHVEKRDLLTLSKQYDKRKIKRVHKKEFEQEVFQRYNALRELGGLPRIRRPNDLNAAFAKVLNESGFFKA